MLTMLMVLALAKPPQRPAWDVVTHKNEMNDQKTTLIGREADRPIKNFLGRPSQPVLVTGCSEDGRPSISFNMGTGGDQSLLLRFDAEEPESIQTAGSTDGKVFFVDYDVREMLGRLRAAKKLLVRFIPAMATPQVVGFNLNGLEAALKTHAAQCLDVDP